MKKISIKDVIDFRRKSPKSKQSFALNLKLSKEKVKTEDGGNYWISTTSAVSESYKISDIQPIIDKKDILAEKHEETDYRLTKLMYKRNIEILDTCEKFDFNKWKPSKEIKFLRKHKDYSILTINELDIQVTPNHIFSFKKDHIENIGAIWFIAKLDGLKKEELGMFADILYRYLHLYYSEKYTISPQYCIAVDLVNGFDINYLQLKKGKIEKILDSTINEIRKLIQ